MPVTSESSAPYAPPSAILEVINRRRDRGLTAPINAEVLARAGVSHSLIPRTLQTLRTLDLIDEGGQPTATFEGLRLAPTGEFQERMQEWLKSAYADVFAFVDPSKDDEVKIADAFRAYHPIGTQRRMVILFRDLCVAAGLVPEKPSVKKATVSLSATSKVGVSARSIVRTATKTPTSKATNVLPPAIAGVLESLPASGEWTRAEREKFMKAFEAMLDFSVAVVKEKKETAEK